MQQITHRDMEPNCQPTMERETVVDRRHVDVREFLALATSFRKLYRVDDAKAGLCGLVDPVTGSRIVVGQDELLEARVTGPPRTRITNL